MARVCSAAAGSVLHCRAVLETRAPETSILYRTVPAHLETFLPSGGEEGRTGLPGFMKLEIEAYLRCGISGRARRQSTASPGEARTSQADRSRPLQTFLTWR
jgi:hypothetical protein